MTGGGRATRSAGQGRAGRCRHRPLRRVTRGAAKRAVGDADLYESVTRSADGRATARVAPTERFVGADDPVHPAPITRHLVGQGPCALPWVRHKVGRADVGIGPYGGGYMGCGKTGRRGNRRSAASGRRSEAVSRKCPDWRTRQWPGIGWHDGGQPPAPTKFCISLFFLAKIF